MTIDRIYLMHTVDLKCCFALFKEPSLEERTRWWQRAQPLADPIPLTLPDTVKPFVQQLCAPDSPEPIAELQTQSQGVEPIAEIPMFAGELYQMALECFLLGWNHQARSPFVKFRFSQPVLNVAAYYAALNRNLNVNKSVTDVLRRTLGPLPKAGSSIALAPQQLGNCLLESCQTGFSVCMNVLWVK